MRLRRTLFGLALGLLAVFVAGCGRKGPLELPADVQAERQAQAAQAEADAAATARASGRRPKLSEEGAPPPPPTRPPLGDPGNRPAPVYPFPLDFLL
ncbi:MAG: lipoprotein [Methylocystis sp.]